MTWNYTGDPANSIRDEIRFLSGDTDKTEPLVTDEECLYAYGKYADASLAAALVLRALAVKESRRTDIRVGDVSESASQRAEAYVKRANELDPTGVTISSSLIVLPSFGGVSQLDNDELDADSDANQPVFKKGQFDYVSDEDDV